MKNRDTNPVYSELRQEIEMAHISLCNEIDACMHLLEDDDQHDYMNGVIKGLQKGCYAAKEIYEDLINHIVYDLIDVIGDDKDIHICKVRRK